MTVEGLMKIIEADVKIVKQQVNEYRAKEARLGLIEMRRNINQAIALLDKSLFYPYQTKERGQ